MEAKPIDFKVSFQKETKSFIVYEHRGNDGAVAAIVYLPRNLYGGRNPETLTLTVSH